MLRFFMFFIALLLFLLIGCGTSSLYECDNSLGIEKDLCRERVSNIQYQIWYKRSQNGYRE